MEELVSVVIPTYNRKNVISRAIDSCINQTYTNIEIIVCDDQSTDGTIQFLKDKYISEERIKYCMTTEGHKGSNAARNQGIRLASGKYIAFLDSDDYLLPDSIENRIEYFNNDREIAMVYGNLYLEFNGQRKEWIYTNLNDDFNQKEYLLREMALCQTMAMIIKKSVFAQIGLMDEKLPAWQDDALVLSIVMNGFRVHHCGKFVGVVIKSNDGITNNKKKIYIGLKNLLSKYKDDIQEMSYIRYAIWMCRLFSSWCYAKEMERKGIMRFFFEFLHVSIKVLVRPFYDAYFE